MTMTNNYDYDYSTGEKLMTNNYDYDYDYD